ncbi:P-loop containing nucleoside triphosphate hydrolase protein [Panaeolus papilionaceus]|nr:P-loop containing nucleoside triphosphate hydrolase protein [Panaeolus papilionaceus]
MTSSVQLAAQHILKHINTNQRPLFAAIQGPQGSGKSYLSRRLQEYLQSPPYSLKVAVLSIDDLYLPHDSLVSLAAAHPHNLLWKGRGQPGTHDVDLGVNLLTAIRNGSQSIELPRFDKSLFSGEGDRMPMDGTGPTVEQPPSLDLLIFEGWCVGFNPITEDELQARWNGIWSSQLHKLHLDPNSFRFEDIQAINSRLPAYLALWNFFDVYISVSTLRPNPLITDGSPYSVIYKWRLEQEHNMKLTNGGRGMTDSEVKLFVDRYIPGYIFFGDLDRDRWAGKGLVLTVDESRNVVDEEGF